MDNFVVLYKQRIVDAVERYNSTLKTKIFYAVKCNPHPAIVQILADMNENFDCASIAEVKFVLQYTNDPSRVIFANPHCSETDIQVLLGLGVSTFVVDSEWQLRAIVSANKAARVMLRLCPQSQDEQEVKLGVKFGATLAEAARLVLLTKQLGGLLVGLCFHMGYPIGSAESCVAQVEQCRIIGDLCAKNGFPVQIIDIGGGFVSESHRAQKEVPGETFVQKEIREFRLEDFVKVVDAVKVAFPGAEICSEPGRFIVEDCMDYYVRADAVGERIQVAGSVLSWYYRPLMFKHRIGLNLVSECAGLEVDEIIQKANQNRNVEVDTLSKPKLIVGNSGSKFDVFGETYQKVSKGDYFMAQYQGGYTFSVYNGNVPANYGDVSIILK